ncbi:MAG TPA: hypothetical protein VEF04_22465, partial [Blastocatellia bacterium]|nr:hypothetical protein [Blastocatellia bacterium]
GFALTFVAILASADSSNIKLLKDDITDRQRRKVYLSSYQITLATYAHLIIFSVLTILIDLVLMAAVSIGRLNGKAYYILALNVFLVFHIIALNIRGVSTFYFILFHSRRKPGAKISRPDPGSSDKSNEA